jgi:2-polyprenyl-6-hydroxyphenyl methylase/3-demethylubiquinone-9 3-methyltransferase
MSERIEAVDNAVYETLGDRWYTADDDPIALLRAESRSRNPWIVNELRARAGGRGPIRVLDLGCGGGFLANALGCEEGIEVTGLDQAEDALVVARAHDASGRVHFLHGDARAIPFPDGEFDAVCAMDFLEHVEDPGAIVREVARVLRPGGTFFFHTFSRTWLSRWLVIRAVEWFIPNTPKNLHVWRLFIRPEELRAHCDSAGLKRFEARSFEPRIRLKDVLSILVRRRVPRDFSFVFTDRPILAGYVGTALRAEAASASV